MKKFFEFLVLSLLVVFYSCEKNLTPEILEFSYESESLKPGSLFFLKALASDPNNDSVYYEWSADEGEFIVSEFEPQTIWKSPESSEGQMFIIKLSISDGEFTVIDSIEINLLKNNPPVIEEIRVIPSSNTGGSHYTLVITASDKDEDHLKYQWFCEQGVLLGFSNSSMVKWMAPHSHSEQIYPIEVIVSDSQDTVMGEVHIPVQKSLNGTLEGNVYHTGTLIPISQASLNIGSLNEITDSMGFFTIHEIPYGTYSILCSKSGFDSFERQVTIVSDSTTMVQLNLFSNDFSANVSGIVQNQEGDAISGVSVTLLNPDNSYSTIQSQSDKYGQFEIQNVPIGMRKFAFSKENDDEYKYLKIDVVKEIESQPTNFIVEMESISIVPVVSSDSTINVSYCYADGFGHIMYDGDTAIIEKGFCLATSENPDTYTHYSQATDPNSFIQAELSNLKANTRYYVKAYAINAYQKIGYGDQLEINTNAYGLLVDDRDGKQYKTIEIGEQVWMAENLNFAVQIGSWCFNDKSSNCDIYGRLYNWTTANSYLGQGKDICPSGWRLPSDSEWKTLELEFGISQQELDDTFYRGSVEMVGRKMKSVDKWLNGNNGINSHGLNLYPSGMRQSQGDFSEIGLSSTFWTSTIDSNNKSYLRKVNVYDHGVYRHAGSIDNGYSVRCIKK